MPKQTVAQDPRIAKAAKELHAFMQRESLTQKKLARLAKVSQPQISKLLRGGVKKMDGDLAKLCAYANITIDLPLPPYNDIRIRNALASVWDGNESTIVLVASLIRCAAHVRRVP